MTVSHRSNPREQAIAIFVSLCLAAPSASAMPQAVADSASSVSTEPHALARPAYHSAQLQGDQRIIHALNRFTFGPRPGDIDAVRRLGLNRWFEQQLHPATLDQTDLKSRLAQYPAMQWSSEDLLYRLPSNAVIRQALDGKAPVPERGALHAVYENQMFRVAEKRQEKQNNQQQAAASGASQMDASNGEQRNGTTIQFLDSLDKALEKDDQADATTMAPGSAKSMQPAARPAVLDTMLDLPPQLRVARLAAMQPSEFDDFFKSLRGPERAALTAGMTPEMKETVGALENPQRTVVEELFAQRLTHDLYSNAQLEEVMTDFWLNHFNVYLRKNEATPYYLVGYERDVIRPHALGKFEDLLEATAHSPAMLLYLDNASSIGPDSLAAKRASVAAARQPAGQRKAPQGLNENYARELMELHTLGVNGGYTQADVTQVARIFTGWGVDRPQRGGGFRFEPNRHEPGAKKVLGKKFKDSGEREGRELLHLLATRQATARFISRKLALRFVNDDPPESIIESMAKSYLSSSGDISVVLKTMYQSPEFWSTDAYRAKVKTPLEYVLSAARASNADISNLRPLAKALREMGMPLYGAVPPTGYKWSATDWVSSGALVNRMNFALSLAANRLPGIATTWSSQPNWGAPAPRMSVAKGPASGTWDERSKESPDRDSTASAQAGTQLEESRLESLLIPDRISDTTRCAVLQQFEAQSAVAQNTQVSTNPRPRNNTTFPAAQEKQDQLLAGLLLGSPEFQRR